MQVVSLRNLSLSPHTQEHTFPPHSLSLHLSLSLHTKAHLTCPHSPYTLLSLYTQEHTFPHSRYTSLSLSTHTGAHIPLDFVHGEAVHRLV